MRPTHPHEPYPDKESTVRHLNHSIATLGRRLREEESGFSTAELLGNAALGVVALVVIWGLLQALGVDLVAMIRDQLLTANTP